MKKNRTFAQPRKAMTALALLGLAASAARADDLDAGKTIYQHRCHGCHLALPYMGRIGVPNLAPFLANPKRYKPTTAMNFPGLKSKKDVKDVIAFITAAH